MKRIHNNISQSNLEARNNHRDKIELLRSRVSLLSGKDKILMIMYLDNGTSFRQMAQLAGVNEANIARRIHKITKRLMDSEYITCLRNRDKFIDAEMAIARDYFLMHLSIKKIAREQHSSYYRIRKTLKNIQKTIRIINQ